LISLVPGEGFEPPTFGLQTRWAKTTVFQVFSVRDGKAVAIGKGSDFPARIGEKWHF
jgi:hypothetical protein